MKNNNENEIKNFLNLFSDNSSQINKNFEHALKKSLLREQFDFKILFMKKLLKPFALILSITLVLSGFIISIGNSKNIKNFDSNVKLVELSEAESTEIISQVNKTNNYNLINSSTQVNINKENNFRRTKIFRKSINKSLCKKMFQNDLFESNTEYFYEYSPEDQVSYIKSETYLNDDQLINYYISINNRNNSTNYEYKGGKYALKDSQEAVASVGFTNPVDNLSIEDARNIFGENLKLYREEGGSNLYILESTYNVNCDSDDTQKIITDIYVDPNSFELLRQNTYLNTKDANHLLENITFDVENTSINNDEAKTLFNYDLAVELKDKTDLKLNREVQEIFITESIDYINKNKIRVPQPKFSNIKFESIQPSYITDILNNNEANYLSDRNFYPEGELGDKMYSIYSTPISSGESKSIFSINFSNYPNLDFISISLIDSNYVPDSSHFDRLPDEIKKQITENPLPDVIEINIDTHIIINGEKYPLKILRKDISPIDQTPSYSGEFDFEGQKYEIIIYTPSLQFDYNNLEFDILDTAEQSTKDAMTQQIKKYYANTK